jgi:hypothetical protein
LAEEIGILREFRDKYLLTNPLGNSLLKLCYKVSQPIAQVMTEHPGLKSTVKVGLLPAVVISTIVVNTTPAEKTAIVGLLVLDSMVISQLFHLRRGG